MMLSRFVVFVVIHPMVRLRLLELGLPTSFALFDVPDIAIISGEKQYVIPLGDLPPVFRRYSPSPSPRLDEYISFKINEVEILY